MHYKDRLRQILSVKEPPRRIAAAFAMGVFIGMSPLLGAHTLLGLILAWLLRLNKLVTLVGVYVTNPWTIVPIYSFGTWLGSKILGLESIVPTMEWSGLTFRSILNEFRHLLMPFVVGSTVTGAAAAIIAYVVIYHAVKGARG